MLRSLFEFLQFSDPNLRTVAMGTILLSASSAVVGCFTFLRKRSLSGDVISHSVLPGICLAFLISGEKDPFLLLAGAFFTGWLSLLLIDYLRRHTRLGEDAGLGIALSVFFGTGIVMLTAIQKSGNAAQAGLDRFLFGKAAAMLQQDVYVFGGLSVILLLSVILFYKEFSLVCFDAAFAKSSGLPVAKIEFLLSTLTVLAVVAGIQAVGVVLMAALLITPAAAARFWTHSLWRMLVIAACIGAFSGLAGTFVSWSMPSMPTGPWMVVIATLLAGLSALLSPRSGVLARIRIKLSHRYRIKEENVLKRIWQLNEIHPQTDSGFSKEQILRDRPSLRFGLNFALIRLRRKGFVDAGKNGWILSDAGKVKGARITRLHRLWEMYLNRYLRIPPDHVHEDAETIEHFITPELETLLENELGRPGRDPHDKEIPRL